MMSEIISKKFENISYYVHWASLKKKKKKKIHN